MRISEAAGGIQLLLTLLSACGIYFPDKMCDRDTASKRETDYRLHSSTRKTTRTTRRPIPSVIRILTTKAVIDRRLGMVELCAKNLQIMRTFHLKS